MGYFVTIEGGDGSGKGTQAELLKESALKIGKDVLKISFPDYGSPSAYYVEQYLNGAYGGADEVPADLAGLAYALDRYDKKSLIEEYIHKPNGFIISDRYVASNMAHQGTKYSDATERRAYYERTIQTEHEILGIPRPDRNLVLLVPTAMAQENVDKKDARSYTSLKRDIHEADASHLDRAQANYQELCELYPDTFLAINCIDALAKQRSREDIRTEIQSLIPAFNETLK